VKFIARVAILVAILFSGLDSAAQEKLRSVEQPARYTYANPPVDVVVKLDDHEMVGREATTGPDWLNRLSFEVTNKSGKDIRFLRIDLILWENARQLPGIVITLDMANTEPKIKILAAGERATLKMDPSVVEIWLKSLKDKGVDELVRVMLRMYQFGFTDGTGWFVGLPTQRSPDGRNEIVPKKGLQPILFLPEPLRSGSFFELSRPELPMQ